RTPSSGRPAARRFNLRYLISTYRATQAPTSATPAWFTVMFYEPLASPGSTAVRWPGSRRWRSGRPRSCSRVVLAGDHVERRATGAFHGLARTIGGRLRHVHRDHLGRDLHELDDLVVRVRVAQMLLQREHARLGDSGKSDAQHNGGMESAAEWDRRLGWSR